MKFIRKHTGGSWVRPHGGYIICKKYGLPIAKIIEHTVSSFSKEEDNANADAVSQIPAMLNYLIERAELLLEQTKFNSSQFNDGIDLKKQEFTRILEMIKAAGVEVVE